MSDLGHRMVVRSRRHVTHDRGPKKLDYDASPEMQEVLSRKSVISKVASGVSGSIRHLLGILKGPPQIESPCNPDTAREIIEKGGGRFYGVESLAPMGLVAPAKLPPLPSRQEIETYAAQGFDLRLIVAQRPDRSASTPASMDLDLRKQVDLLKESDVSPDGVPSNMGQPYYAGENANGIVYIDYDQTKYRGKYDKDVSTPFQNSQISTCWAFTSGVKSPANKDLHKSFVPGTAGGYVGLYPQMESLYLYFKNVLYKDKPLPEEIRVACDEFANATMRGYSPIRNGTEKQVVSAISKLQISQFSPNLPEAIYMIAQTFFNSSLEERKKLLDSNDKYNPVCIPAIQTRTKQDSTSFLAVSNMTHKGIGMFTTDAFKQMPEVGIPLIKRVSAEEV